MKISRRTKRMKQHHARRADRNATLNMVSLMDIFTILVFFLLVNATSAEVLQAPANIKLPDSTSKIEARETLMIIVNQKQIKLQGRTVVSTDNVLNNSQTIIKPLQAELKRLASKLSPKEKKQGVTILGDKAVPYELIKKIMFTAASVEFGNISFAVNQQTNGNL